FGKVRVGRTQQPEFFQVRIGIAPAPTLVEPGAVRKDEPQAFLCPGKVASDRSWILQPFAAMAVARVFTAFQIAIEAKCSAYGYAETAVRQAFLACLLQRTENRAAQ